MSRPRLSAEQVAQLRRDRRAGKMLRELADRHGVTLTTVSRALLGKAYREADELEPPLVPGEVDLRFGHRSPHRALTDVEALELRRAYLAGVSVAALGRRYGIGQGTVKQVLDRVSYKTAE